MNSFLVVLLALAPAVATADLTGSLPHLKVNGANVMAAVATPTCPVDDVADFDELVALANSEGQFEALIAAFGLRLAGFSEDAAFAFLAQVMREHFDC